MVNEEFSTWYNQYKNNIVNNKRIETYFILNKREETFLTQYYQEEWNNKNMVQNSLRNDNIFEGLRHTFIAKERKLLEKMNLSIDNYFNINEVEKIHLWTKIFNLSYEKTYEEEEPNLTDEDCFWITLSSVNFMDAFGANSSNNDTLYRHRIRDAITEYLRNINNNNSNNNNNNNFNKGWDDVDELDKAGFFQKLFSNKEDKITIGNYTYTFLPSSDNSSKEVDIRSKKNKRKIEHNFKISFFSSSNETTSAEILQEECKKNFKEVIKEVNRSRGYGGLGIQIGNSINNSESAKLFLIESGDKDREEKRGNIMIKMEEELSSYIENEAKGIEKNENIKFTTANGDEVRNFLSWYYRTSKKGTYNDSTTEKGLAFQELQRKIGDVEKSYYNIFCKAIYKSIESLGKDKNDKDGIILQLGHQKTFNIKKQGINRALGFFTRYKKKKFYDLLFYSESIHFLGNLYSYQAQLGTIGELLAVKNFSSRGFEAKSQGQNYDKIDFHGKQKSLGESFQDITVKYKKINFGVNVKHFLSDQSNDIKLYKKIDQNRYSLNSDALIKYMNEEDYEFVNYLNINAPYIEKVFDTKIKTSEELEKIFNKYVSQFLRMTGSPLLEKKSENLFYQLNNLIIPSSILLDKIIKSIEKKNFFFKFENINKKIFKYEDIKSNNYVSKCLEQKVPTKVVFQGLVYQVPNGV